MKVSAMPVGQLQTNCYMAWDENTKACAVIDPGDDGERILKYLNDNGLKLKYIFLTHGHFDHVMALETVRDATGATVYISPKESTKDPWGMLKVDLSKNVSHYDEGDEIVMDGLTFKVLSTPGHTPGSVVLLCGDYMFSGDTLFASSCGRTDFPGGSWQQMLKSLKRLHDLEGDYHVLSGHSEATTLERERRTNVYMREAVSGR